MSNETVHGLAELATVFLLVAAPLMLIRYYTTRVRQDGDPFGIGWRAIQIVVVVIAIPAIVILAFEGIISKDVTGTLFGSVLGYALSPKGGT